ESIPYFNGTINGNNHTIINLRTCLLDTIAGNGSVKNIVIRNAATLCSPAIARHMQDSALVRCVDIRESNFICMGDKVKPSLSFGVVSWSMSNLSRIENVLILDSDIQIVSKKVSSYFMVGSVVGIMSDDSRMHNILVMKTNILVQERDILLVAEVGCAVGVMKKNSRLENFTAIDTKMRTHGYSIKGNRAVFSVGTVGAMHDNSRVSNIVRINDYIGGFRGLESSAGGSGSMWGGSMQHLFVFNSTILSVRSKGEIGIAVGFQQNLDYTNLTISTDNVITFSALLLGHASKEELDYVKVGGCVGNVEPNTIYQCCL
ncbi:MAG: hypothetical protein QS748_14490, partial [Candidatus Endonucleobacter bathymodioli]|nr:hypothetical protein [Candidatus Endonucleobacter bathymodioli]